MLTDACWALSYLSDGQNDKIQAVIEAGVCQRLVELLIHTSPAVQTPALRTVGNIVTGDDLQTQVRMAIDIRFNFNFEIGVIYCFTKAGVFSVVRYAKYIVYQLYVLHRYMHTKKKKKKLQIFSASNSNVLGPRAKRECRQAKN